VPARRLTRMITALIAAAAGALAVGSPAFAAAPQPFGHACTAQNGVRFCPTTGSANRVSTFDGIPLDADVTLPPTGTGPWPTIAMMHGWGGSKTAFEASSPDASHGYNNVYFAQHGYAVLNYTARGFGNSCGHEGEPAETDPACGQGYIRLADSRYEARDTQYLLGLLADQGITKRRMIGVTGVSYGGGQSTELAFLHNKIRKPNGDLAPWQSPDGLNMSIAAAYPRWPWSDLIDALLPNGRFLDSDVAPKKQSLNPVGVPIQSYIAGLFALGATSGYYCGTAPASSPCTDSDADLPQNFGYVNAGQPITPPAEAALNETYTDKSGYAIRFMDGAVRPAPLLIQNGFTDDLFPPEQALRVYNYVRSRYPAFDVSLQFGDLGHSRGANEDNVNEYFTNQGASFFDAYLKGGSNAPAAGSVATFDETCQGDADAGPYRAPSWSAIHVGSLRFGGTAPQTFTGHGGDPDVAAAFDPIGGTSDSCKTIAREQEPNTATYDKDINGGFHMMGMTTIRAHIATTGPYGEIVGRLWDIDPGAGTQRLIDRGVYSLEDNQTGDVKFQLHGNGYRFRKGHQIELELLGRDAPYYRQSNGIFTVTVSNLTVDLPGLARAAVG
jgi:fermentation-respiration switch protein FrsA (DUF1100 family)